MKRLEIGLMSLVLALLFAALVLPGCCYRCDTIRICPAGVVDAPRPPAHRPLPRPSLLHPEDNAREESDAEAKKKPREETLRLCREGRIPLDLCAKWFNPTGDSK